MLDIVLSPLEPIVGPVLALVNGFIQIGYFLVEILKLLPRALEIFNYIIDPMKVIKDIIYGLTTGLMLVIEGLFDSVLGDVRKAMGGSYDPGSNDGDYTGENGVCLSKTFMGTLLMVLCPPLYIILNLGIIKGFFPTLLCCLLTYFYYVPGLIYASLYSFCPV
jgi:uncharacterized membrane protein YqaE (UPF0057 family)